MKSPDCNSEEMPSKQSVSIVLTERQNRICNFLDLLSTKNQFWRVSPSNLFKGALYVSYPSRRIENPDWMAQAAHSLRDIIYSIPPNPTKKDGIKNIIEKYREVEIAEEVSSTLSGLKEVLTDIAHHFSGGNSLGDLEKKLEKMGIEFSQSGHGIDEKCFQEILGKLEEAWDKSLPGQLRIFELVDDVLTKDKVDTSSGEIKSLFLFGFHIRLYFYAKADESQLSWLWENGFLDPIKRKPEDPTQYFYRTPELNYLARMAGRAPKLVTDIMLSVPVSADTFNPEAIDRFLGICSELPAEELARVIPKIVEDDWIVLMKGFRHFGFQPADILKKLVDAGDWRSVLLLASVLLRVREKEEGSAEEKIVFSENPFLFEDIEYSDLFEILQRIDNPLLEESIVLVSRTVREIIYFNADKRMPKEAFSIGDGLAFYDVDFFELEDGQKRRVSYRDDVRSLMVLFKNLAARIFKKVCGDEQEAERIFRECFDIGALPDSQAMWRFRLFVLGLCPKSFERRIKDALFRIGSVERANDLTSAEYKRLLMQSFQGFSEDEKRDYKGIVFRCFAKKDEETLTREDVFGVCSIIREQLSSSEKELAESYAGRPLIDNYIPSPAIGPVMGGTVKDQSPVSQDDLNRPVPDLVEQLKGAWSPEKLKSREEWTEGSITHYGVKGLGNAIRNDIPKRFQEYVSNAALFFEPGSLDEHYTYVFLGGIQDAIKSKEIAPEFEWGGLFSMFEKISDYLGSEPSMDTGSMRTPDTWSLIVGWDATYRSVADLMNQLIALRKDKPSIIEFTLYRETILNLTEHLLKHPDPTVESEVCVPRQNVSVKSGEVQYDCSDPFTHAINSVRGKAFEVLINFMYRDGGRFDKDDSVKISGDVKTVYLNTFANEDTRAIRFLFGHYLPSVYYRDREWIAERIIPALFEFGTPAKGLGLAAWEGYLTNNLYDDLFQALEPYYLRAIKLSREEYTPREYFKDIDEALATHVSLGFAHFQFFTLESEIFQEFWKKENLERHEEFVSFVGRYAISRDQAKTWIGKNKISSKKLEGFWDWILGQEVDPKVFESFGSWMDAEWEVFDPVWQAKHTLKTLEKTGGVVEWDHNLQQSLPAYAVASPETTLEILRLYMLGYVAKKAERQGWVHIDDETIKTFKTLYNNIGTRKGIYDLVAALLPYGNGQFWSLKDIIKE